MKPIRTAIFGTGFMGRVHLEAVRRVESVEAVAIAGRNAEAAQRLGAGFSIPTIADRLSRNPARSGDRCRPHLHAQRAAFFHGQGRASGGQACALRKAAGHER